MYKPTLIFFFLFFSNLSYAEDKIVYLDVNILLSKSEVGKYVNSNLKKIRDKNNEEFKKFENEIKSDEGQLLNQQNILKKEDFDKKISELRNKFKSYQENKKLKNTELNKLRNHVGNKILKIINEILTEYSKNNSISLVVEKKNIVIGKSELDVTNDILKLLNEKIIKVELN
jgi:outer membrane protein